MDRLKEIKDKITFDRRIAVNLLTNEAVDWLVSEIERLRKEKEWLIKLLLSDYRTYSIEELKEIITKKMQQTLKEIK